MRSFSVYRKTINKDGISRQRIALLLHLLDFEFTKMVEQKELDLNKPLDASASAVISRIPLDPSLATLALTLHGDYFRQLQSKCNRRIVWDPLVLLLLLAAFVGFTSYLFYGLYEVSDSFGEFLELLWRNKLVLTNYFPALIVAASFVGVITFSITDEFRTMSDMLGSDAYMATLFRFPLRIYANATEEDMDSPLIISGSESTDLIEYRESPIAVVTVVPEPEKSGSLTFYAKIAGLHVRKAYSKAGLESELLQYAKEKAKHLAARYAKDNKLNAKNLKIILMAEGYTIDSVLPSLYLNNGFKIVGSTYNINFFTKEERSEKVFKFIPVTFFYRFFSILRIFYELELKN